MKAYWVILLVLLSWVAEYFIIDAVRKGAQPAHKDSVAVQITLPPVTENLDSLKAVIAMKERQISKERKSGAEWKATAERYKVLAEKMAQDSTGGVTFYPVAILDHEVAEPNAFDDDHYVFVGPDTMHTEYDLATESFRNSMMKWGKRVVAGSIALPPLPPPEIRYQVPWYYYAGTVAAVLIAAFAGHSLK